MKWDYKIITLDALFPEQLDHDIAVSQKAATSRRSKMGKGLENNLKQQGAVGWELISIYGEYGIFKKQIES